MEYIHIDMDKNQLEKHASHILYEMHCTLRPLYFEMTQLTFGMEQEDIAFFPHLPPPLQTQT